jgi:hypothetical protein
MVQLRRDNMNKLKEYLLTNGYTVEHIFGEKAFTVKWTNGAWSKSVTISKYRRQYEVDITEGLPNIIKVRKGKFDTYKEAIKFIG